jgi:flagellar biosynthesis/type III secretory pathway protein FliH
MRMDRYLSPVVVVVMSMSSLSIGKGFAGLVSAEPGRAAIKFLGGRGQPAEVDIAERKVRKELEAQYRIKLEAQEARIVVLLDAIEQATSAFMLDFETKVVGQMMEMSLQIAELIIRSRLPDREMIAEVISKTLAPIMDLQGVRIKLSASDAATIQSCTKDGLAKILTQVEIAVDSDLEDGDVVVESRNGYFNARIGDRMKLLEEQLKERCGNVIA